MSDNRNWFTTGSNDGMTATDTQKNTVRLRPSIYCHGLRKCPCGTLTFEGETDVGASKSAFRLFLGAAGVLHCQKVQPAMHCRGVCDFLGAALCRHISKGMFTPSTQQACESLHRIESCHTGLKDAGHPLALSSSSPLLNLHFAIRRCEDTCFRCLPGQGLLVCRPLLFQHELGAIWLCRSQKQRSLWNKRPGRE